MTRARSIRLLAAAAAGFLAACADRIDPGDRGDPDAPVDLWKLSRGGKSDVVVPFASAGSTGAGVAGTSAGGASMGGAGGMGVGGADAGPEPAGDPSLALLDPDEVHLFGTLSEGACDMDAIAPVLAPDHALVGFECSASTRGGFVRPSDGRLVYLSRAGDVVYAFHCDGCSYETAQAGYPTDPTSNDERIATPCPDSPFTGGVRVTAEGEVVHLCPDAHWYDSQGRELPGLMSAGVLSLGHERTALRSDGVVDLMTGELMPFTGLEQPRVLAQRARDDGYWIVVQPEEIDQALELWHVAFDAGAALLGTYADPPAEQQLGSESELDGEGRLVQTARIVTPTSLRDTVVRRSIEGESAVIYDEADDPVVKLHVSTLFTGP